MGKLKWMVFSTLFFISISVGFAQVESVDLTELSLEELMNIEVSLASKKIEKVSNVAAAISVITSDDIKYSGVTSIAEALRMVPGFEVGKLDASKWAISSRGFNSLFANKLLVLIDGRSVYTPMFSGVFWEAQDIFLEDLDQIEVIRGPGATLWGANAVNGIINVITKNARETQGGLLVTGIGTDEKQFTRFRYGQQIGKNIYYRVYGKYFKRDSYADATGKEAFDGWNALRGGFRMDWDMSESSVFKLQGDIYNGRAGTKLTVPNFDPYKSGFSGGNILGSWKHTFSERSDFTLQFYYDQVRRVEKDFIAGRYHTFDIDFQHRVQIHQRHSLVWGFEYLLTADNIENSAIASFDPSSRQFGVISAFVQEEWDVCDQILRLIAGSKFEHNDFTGFEVQPNMRMIWKPSNRYALWGAVSRAIRSPSRADHDIWTIFIEGDRAYKSEEVTAFELGSHYYPTANLYCDIAVFYNIYDKLQSFEPFKAANKRNAKTYGIECSFDWKPYNRMRLRAAYTYLKINASLDEGSQYRNYADIEGESPEHQFSLITFINMPYKMDLNVWTRYVDRLSTDRMYIEAYFNLDVCLTVHLLHKVELSIVGQNLLDDHHPEFSTLSIPFVSTEVQRGFYGSVQWEF